MGEGFFRVPQEGRGLCKKCTCPEYHPPKLLRSKRKIDYTSRTKPIDVESEERCSRCGRLLSNHQGDVGHLFQK